MDPEPQLLPTFKSSPIRAFQAVFDSPNWVGNLLWLSLAFVAQCVFIGQIGLFGYGSELLLTRAGRPENMSPDIDSNRLGDYISAGLWPFVVSLVVQFAISFVMIVPILIVVFGGLAMGAAIGGEDGAAASFILTLPIIFMIAIFFSVLSVPFLIRAMVCQDFVKSLDLGWAIGFVKLMFWEIVVSFILFWLLALVVIVMGLALLCVGYIPAAGLAAGAMMNLLAQWYEIYLSRGGEPAPAAEEAIIDATVV